MKLDINGGTIINRMHITSCHLDKQILHIAYISGNGESYVYKDVERAKADFIKIQDFIYAYEHQYAIV
jgi:putative NIF3 family GTP cyclohydrolase 1 type 2